MLRIHRFGLAMVVSLAASQLSAKDYDAERFDVGFRLERDGSALVHETVVFRFHGGPFTYVFRDLDTTRTDGIDDIRVQMDGQPMGEGVGPGQAEVRTGKPVKVIWHFAPTSDAAHIFEITYRALGVVRVSGTADSVLWQAIPHHHRYRIAEGSVTLEYPAATSLAERPGLRGANARVVSGPGETRFEFGRVNQERAVTLSAAFAPGSLASSPPHWQAREEKGQERLHAVIPAGVAAGIAAFALLLLWFLRRRAGTSQEPPYGPADLLVRRPPSGLAPALAGRLVSMAQPAGHLVMATLFDLAARGAVRIEEASKRRFRRDFQLKLLAPEVAALPHQRYVLDVLFGKGSIVRLSEAGPRLIQKSAGFERSVIEEMVSNGLVDAEQYRVRSRMMTLGMIILGVGMIAFLGGVVSIGSISRASAWQMLPAAAMAVGAGAGLFLASIVGLILFSAATPLTLQGRADEFQWRAFRRYLRAVAKGREMEIDPRVFECYLPYATAFGSGEAWARHFKNRGDIVIPEWFQAAGTDDGGASMIALIAVSSSSGGDGGAGAGGGGASGGGASGAG